MPRFAIPVAFLFTFTVVLFASGAGCLRGVSVEAARPTGTAVCATFAAAPSAAPPMVASATPVAGPNL